MPSSEEEEGLLPSGLNNRLVQRRRVRGSFAPASPFHRWIFFFLSCLGVLPESPSLPLSVCSVTVVSAHRWGQGLGGWRLPMRAPGADSRRLADRGLGRRAAPVCVNGGLWGWKELTQPGDALPLPRCLFTFAVLLAEPPVDALHHPGQLLLLQLPLLLPGLRGARGPLSARCASATRPRLHSAAAAAAAPRAPRSLPGRRRWGRRRQQQRQQPEEAEEPQLRPRGAVSSQEREVIGELRRAGWKWKGPRTNGQRAAAERRVVWEGAAEGGGESTGLLARPRPGCRAEEPRLPKGGCLWCGVRLRPSVFA